MKEYYRRDSQNYQLPGVPYIHILTVLGTLVRNLLCETPILLFRKSQLGIIEERQS